MPKTLFEKVWESHVVAERPDSPAILYIDLHLVHEVTSPQAFSGLRQRGLQVRRPERTVATMDHSIPTTPLHVPIADPLAAAQIRQMEANAAEFGITLHGMASAHRGIVHVIGPELGLTQPGMTIVCGDSHTATHGAFGALAFGIGTSEVEHVLASQCLLQTRPRTCEVRVDGSLPAGVSAGRRLGEGPDPGADRAHRRRRWHRPCLRVHRRRDPRADDGTAHDGVQHVDRSRRARRHDRPRRQHLRISRRARACPERRHAAVARWRTLASDAAAVYDHGISLDASALEPMITFGTNPGMGIGISGRVPDPAGVADTNQKSALDKALRYMGLQPGQALLGQKVDVVFIGSCTNSRISDLREAASLLRGRKVAGNVRLLVVPGSQVIKQQAEAEGLDEVFRSAGAEWREPGCSMCIAMNGDQLQPGQYAVSTSNRNFEGRQGQGGRTFLASPLTAAASAVAGAVADPRTCAGGR